MSCFLITKAIPSNNYVVFVMLQHHNQCESETVWMTFKLIIFKTSSLRLIIHSRLSGDDYDRPQEKRGNLSDEKELKLNKGNPLHTLVVMVTY